MNIAIKIYLRELCTEPKTTIHTMRLVIDGTQVILVYLVTVLVMAV